MMVLCFSGVICSASLGGFARFIYDPLDRRANLISPVLTDTARHTRL